MNYKEIKRWSSEYNNQLKCTDHRFRYNCRIIHRDKSSLFLTSAFLVQKENWLCCFTEHHGVFIYDKDDLINYQMLTQYNWADGVTVAAPDLESGVF